MVKLFVGNLQEGSITSDDLKPLFESYGTVTGWSMVRLLETSRGALGREGRGGKVVFDPPFLGLNKIKL